MLLDEATARTLARTTAPLDPVIRILLLYVSGAATFGSHIGIDANA
jgi:hypothetical protein